MEIIRESHPVARKVHICNACEFLREQLRETDFTFNEMRIIVRARRQGWMIQPGQIYLQQILKHGGDFYVFKAIPAIDDLCWKYDLYPQD